MSKLLVDEYPLIILPGLACAVGLNEAIVLQQLHYWLEKSQHDHDGRRWVYNTYEQWQEQFPFWSIPTIRRALTSLRNPYTPTGETDQRPARGPLVLVGNYNVAGFDNTLWWALDYGELDRLEGLIRPSDQKDQTIGSKRSDGADQNDQTNTRDYQRQQAETKSVVVALTDDQMRALDALLALGFQPRKTAEQYARDHEPGRVLGWCEYAQAEEMGAGFVRTMLDAGEPAPAPIPQELGDGGQDLQDEEPTGERPPSLREQEAARWGISPETWALWERAKGDLALQMTRATFDAWLRGAVLLRVEDGTATIGTANPNAVHWLGSRLAPVIARNLGRLVGTPVVLEFELLEGR